MKKITEHQVNPANDKLTITVLDEPGAGGACHLYKIDGFSCPHGPLTGEQGGHPVLVQHPNFVVLPFQNGPIGEVGINGITQEALLAILLDRMRAFQAGPYACRENAIALTKMEEAQMWLHRRTQGRMARGVEGTHAK